jgi:DNA-binding GntR family transcriptional regulator
LSITQRYASPDEAQRLKLADAASIWDIRRLRLLTSKPVIEEISLIPVVLAPDLDLRLSGREDLSLYDVLGHEYGLHEVREEQSLTCRRATVKETTFLKLSRGDWVAEIAGVALTTGSLPIDAFRMVFDAKAFTFRMSTVTPVEIVQAPDSELA